MSVRSLFTGLACFLSFASASAQTESPPLVVFSSNATKAVLEELAASFTASTGHRIAFTFSNSIDLSVRIRKGEPFDAAILTAPLVGELTGEGRLAAATRTGVARAGVGVAVHLQATRPDVSSADALKGALVAARSIGYVGQGVSASIMQSVFEKLELTEAMNAKTRLVANAAVAVANREVELAFTQVSEILNVPGAVLAGPLPRELQVYTTYEAVASSRANNLAGAMALMKFLTAPAAAAVITSKGMEPMPTTQDRLPPIAPAEMSPAQKQAADEFRTARGVDLSGPFHPLLRSPELLTRTRAMGDYLRFKSLLPPRLSEFVILLTAREWTQQYEWNVHHPIAIKAGLRPEVAQAIADGTRPAGMSDDESILLRLLPGVAPRQERQRRHLCPGG